LGLSDDGRIWSWNDNSKPARLVEFNEVETSLGPRSSSKLGTVTKVLAGWEINSAFIIGTGIVHWDRNDESSLSNEAELHISCRILPGSGFRRSDPKRGSEYADSLGEVRNYIILSGFIVFITHLNKVFAVMVDEQRIVELSTFSGPGRELQDIQGAFQRFAVFTSAGEVLLGDVVLIEGFFSSLESDDPDRKLYPEPRRPLCLQHSNVISISFGDYHFAALHANGRISTHGTEPQGCGALGLGSLVGGLPFRSLTFVSPGARLSFRRDITRFPFAENSIRYVWFEREKMLWLGYLYQQSQDGTEVEAWLTALEQNQQGLLERYSSCIEKEGESWDDFTDIKELDPDGLGAYFALNVGAAGWHCAALVLVNEDLAAKVRAKHILDYGDRVDRGGNFGQHYSPTLYGLAPLILISHLPQAQNDRAATKAENDTNNCSHRWPNGPISLGVAEVPSYPHIREWRTRRG
jgi:SCF-associated factor 1